MKQVAIAALLVVLTFISCNTVEPNPNVSLGDPNPGFGLGSLAAFPTQPKSDGGYPTALTQGRLVVADGCLRLQAPSTADFPYETDYLLYWRYGDNYQETDEGIQVLDADGKVLAKVGDYFEVGGGETPVDITQGTCEGPTWFIGEIVSATEPQ